MEEMLRVLVPVVVAHVCVLAVLLIIVKKVLLNDTMKAVERIQAVEGEVRKKEETIRREIQEHEKAFAKQKIEAEEELQRHKAQTEKELGRLRDQMLAEAKRESDRIIEQARKNEQQYREKIEANVEQKAVDYGAELFSMVFGERVTSELNKQFNAELMDALNDIDGDSITIESAEGDVIVGQAMEAEQKKQLEDVLAGKFGRPIQLVERIDPELMTGLVLKLGSLEIDGSLRNRFQEAVTELSKAANE